MPTSIESPTMYPMMHHVGKGTLKAQTQKHMKHGIKHANYGWFWIIFLTLKPNNETCASGAKGEHSRTFMHQGSTCVEHISLGIF